MLVFTKLDFTFTTRHTHNWGSFLLRSSCFILSGAVSKCPLPIGHLPTWGGLISQHHLFALSFLGFLGFLQQEYWSGLPFLPPVDHVLSEFSTVTLPSWVALHGMVHSFIELCKPLQHDKAVIHDRCVCVCVCVCVSHLLCPFLCGWAFRLLPCLGSCKQCCSEHWGACTFSDYSFVQIHAQEWGHTVALYLVFLINLCTDLDSDCTDLQSHQQFRTSVHTRPLQHLLAKLIFDITKAKHKMELVTHLSPV